MSRSPEYSGDDVALNNEFDHTFRHTFLDEMRNPALQEPLGLNVHPETGILRDALEPLVDGHMVEWFRKLVIGTLLG